MYSGARYPYALTTLVAVVSPSFVLLTSFANPKSVVWRNSERDLAINKSVTHLVLIMSYNIFSSSLPPRIKMQSDNPF